MLCESVKNELLDCFPALRLTIQGMDLKLGKSLHDLHRFKTNRQDLEKERQRISRISLLCGEVVEVVDNAAVLVHFHAGTLNNPVKSGTLVNHVLLSLKRDALDRDEVVVDELRLVLYCRRHYTPGLLLGKPIHWKDSVDRPRAPQASHLMTWTTHPMPRQSILADR